MKIDQYRGRTNSMIGKFTRAITACLTVAIALFGGIQGVAWAQGNLQERFKDVPRVEYGGETYYLRARLTSVLLTGIVSGSDGERRADFCAVIVIDDNEKQITPIYIDGRTLVDVEGDCLPLQEAFVSDTDVEANCMRMVEAANAVLGNELVESYMAIDLDGLSGIAEFAHLEGDARQRLHLLRLALESIPSERMEQIYDAFGDHLITDMKSGEVARVIDKAERYEIAEMLDMTEYASEESEEDGALALDEERVLEAVLPVFYGDDLL